MDALFPAFSVREIPAVRLGHRLQLPSVRSPTQQPSPPGVCRVHQLPLPPGRLCRPCISGNRSPDWYLCEFPTAAVGAESGTR